MSNRRDISQILEPNETASRQVRARVESPPTTPLELPHREHDEFSTPNHWWMVDLHADPPLRQGATRLVRECMKQHAWDEAYARRVLRAYRQFLTIKKRTGDRDAKLLSPSVDVDRMWHTHILDLTNYLHDCMLLCGQIVSHNPDGMYDGEEKRVRKEATAVL